MKNIFVSGATGFQGGAIANAFLNNGYQVYTLSRGEQIIKEKPEHLHIINGGFEDEQALNQALNNTDKAVFTLPMIFDMDQSVHMTQMFIKAAKNKGIKQVIFNTSFDLPNRETGFLALDIKVAVKTLLEESELQVVTVVPDIYIDNLVAPWSLPLILEQGILPYPVKSGQKIPWISHTNLAEHIFKIVETPELSEHVFPVSNGLFTGEEIAEAMSKHLNKPVQFISLTPNEFEENLVTSFGSVAAKEISNLYRYLDENINQIINKPFKETRVKLDTKEESLETWVKQVTWQVETH